MSGEYTSGIPHECCNGIQSDYNAGCRGKSDLTDTDGIKYQTVLGEIMSKISFKAGNMLYPLPVVMVSVADKEGKSNILTVAWAGTVCTNPPMVSISVRPERYSYHMLKETGEFVINLTTRDLAKATDYCGVRSGRDVDKWKEMNLTPVPSLEVKVPSIAESPVNIECRVHHVEELGKAHCIFTWRVLSSG